jgi:1-acyl-sn-glycerol-3-phosphate acyltransferase
MDSWKTKYVFPAMGMIPIDRGGGEAAERALSTAARVLDAGEFFGIYPEGTRARDGKLHRGRTGAARLALRTGAPIIPVGMKGTREIQPPDAKMPKPFKSCEISFGRPIDVARYLDRADDRMVSRQITDEVMYEIRELTGQDYVDEYASKKAEGIPAAETAQVVELQPTGTNGHGGGDAPSRRSSADVLQPRS